MGFLLALRRFAKNENANVALTFALTLPVMLGFGALAIDEASLYQERRMAQSAVDLASISAARDPANAEQIVRDILHAQGMEPGALEVDIPSERLQVQLGNYQPDPDLAPTDRFDPDGAFVNAVHVRYRRSGKLFFAGWWATPPEIFVASTATVMPEVAFSVGSRLASLNGGVLNALLGGLLGTNLSLDVMSYQALIGAQLDLFQTLDALAVEMDVEGVTYDDLLSTQTTGGTLSTALAEILDGDAGFAAGLIAEASPGGTLDLQKLFDLGRFGSMAVGTAPSGLVAGVSALEMLIAAASLSDGESQVALNLDFGVPGLANLTAKLAVGAPPDTAWFVVGQRDAVARTAQMRLQVLAQLLGNSATGNGTLNLPIYLEMAYAEAQVNQASCPSTGSPNGTADIATRPGIVRMALGEAPEAAFLAFNAPPRLNPAEILTLPLARVTGSAALDIGSLHPEMLRFSSTDIGGGQIHTATTDTMLESAVSSLLGNLDLDVEVLGLGLGTALLGRSVELLISPVAPVLDSSVNLLLNTLGLSLGEADVRVYDIICSRVVLVG